MCAIASRRNNKKLGGTMLTIEQINKLEQENAELKAELEPYKHPDVITLLTNWRTGELDRTHNKIANERDKYRQTLQEIKEIAITKEMPDGMFFSTYEVCNEINECRQKLKQILEKIAEVMK